MTSLQSSTHGEWSEFFQNSDTSSGDLRTYEAVKKDETQDCQNCISTAHQFQLIKHRVWSPASIKMMVAVWGYNTENRFLFIPFNERMINVFINTVLPSFTIYKAKQ